MQLRAFADKEHTISVILDQYQSHNWSNRASFVSTRRPWWNEKTITFPVDDYLTVEIHLKDTFENQPDMASIAPMRFDELGSELHEADLLFVRTIGLEPRARKRRLPFESVEVDLIRLHGSRR